MTGPTKHTDHLRKGSHRLIREFNHDPYKPKVKLPEPTVCPQCGSVYHKGRWDWSATQEGSHKETCPACRRIQDKVPAGFLTLRGEFLTTNKEEMLNLIHNVEARENAEHPLKRIMDIEEQEDGLLITFTDPHLARGVGEAIYHAYQGELTFKYTEEDIMLRVFWTR